MTQSLLFGPGRGLLAQAAQHFVLRTIRNDTPTFHNDEPVHEFQHAQPVRDQDQRLVAHHRFEAVFDHLLGRIVHVAGRLVEDQDVRVPHQRAGQGHGLALAAGQGHAPLADLRPEPGRVGTDELRHARQRGRPQDHLVVANRMEKSPAFESGGAGLASTLDDYMKFAQMLMQGGSLNGVRVLSEKTTKYFTSPELMPVSQKVFSEWVGLDGYSYGNLMRVCKNPAQCGYLAMQDEYGWDGWLGVYFANLPNEKTTILMGMQKVDAGTFSMTRKIRNRIVSKL